MRRAPAQTVLTRAAQTVPAPVPPAMPVPPVPLRQDPVLQWPFWWKQD